MKRLSTTLLTAALVMSLSGCATIMHGTKQTIGVSSCPTNANVWVDGIYVSNTPALIVMKRNENHLVKIQLDGFEPYECLVTKKLSGWVLGNIIFGGIIGLAVDAISGGIYELTPEQIQIEMRAQGIENPTAENCVFVTLKANPNWKKIYELTPAN